MIKKDSINSEPFYMSKPWLKFIVIIPCLILHIIIIFIYVVFICFYTLPLLNDSYWYDNNPNTQLTENQMPFFRQFRNIEDAVFHKFLYFKDIEPINSTTNQHMRGIFLCIVMHYLLFWLILSLIQTMKTDPGSPPNPDSAWATKIENLVSSYHEREKNIVKRFVTLDKVLNQNRALKTEFKTDSPGLRLDHRYSLPDKIISEEENSFIGLIMEKKTDMNKKIIENDSQIKYDNDILGGGGQGKQGANSEKSFFFSLSENSEEEKSPELTEKDIERINETALGRVMKWGIFRFCRHCKSFKPLRTHHCRQCMQCVLKMDHHCQWVLNCIGLKNYKYFMNVLIYAILSLLFVMITFSRCVVDVALNPYIEGITIYIILLAYVLTIVMLGIISGFTTFHFWLIFTGKTTLEHCEKEKKDKLKENSEDNEKEEEQTQKINYSNGIYNNFVIVFNKNPLLWFFPLSINQEVSGLYEDYEDFYIKEVTEKN